MNNKFILILILFLIIDILVITLNYNMYKNQYNLINNENIIINDSFYISILITYLLLAFCFYYFIIIPKESISKAFLLGLCIYGIYNFTNKATINKWGMKESIIDTLWGGILFTIIKYIYDIIFTYYF
jgi:uncharacterized membrane protein